MPRARKVVVPVPVSTVTVPKADDPLEQKFPGGVAEIYAITDPSKPRIERDDSEFAPWEVNAARATSIMLTVYQKEGWNNITSKPNMKETVMDIPIYPVSARTDMLGKWNKVLSPMEILVMLLDHEGCGVNFGVRVPQTVAPKNYKQDKDSVLQKRVAGLAPAIDVLAQETDEEKETRMNNARLAKLNKLPPVPDFDDVEIQSEEVEAY